MVGYGGDIGGESGGEESKAVWYKSELPPTAIVDARTRPDRRRSATMTEEFGLAFGQPESDASHLAQPEGKKTRLSIMVSRNSILD